MGDIYDPRGGQILILIARKHGEAILQTLHQSLSLLRQYMLHMKPVSMSHSHTVHFEKQVNWLGSCCDNNGIKYFYHGFFNSMYRISSKAVLFRTYNTSFPGRFAKSKTLNWILYWSPSSSYASQYSLSWSWSNKHIEF